MILANIEAPTIQLQALSLARRRRARGPENYGIGWYGMVSYGVVWYGTRWYIIAQYGMVPYSILQYGIV